MKGEKIVPEIVIISFISIMSGNWGNYFRWIIISILLLLIIIRLRVKLFLVKMPGQGCYFAFLAICLGNGFISILTSKTDIWSVTRDIILVTTYYIAWLCFCELCVAYKKNCILMWNSVFLSSGLIAGAIILVSLPRLTEGLESFSEFVEGMPSAQWAIAIGIYLYLIHPPEMGKYYVSPWIDKILFLFEIVVSAISLSRTCIIILICLLLPLIAHRKGIIVLIRYSIIICASLYVMYMLVPDVVLVFMDKVRNSIMEVNSNNQWTLSNAVQNWRGYEVYAAVQEFSNYNNVQMLIGKGFGAIVHTPYAWLVTGESGLPFLHNGYFTALIKGGIIGFILFISVFVRQYTSVRYIFIDRIYQRKICIGIIIGLMVTSLVVQGIFFGSMYFIPLLILAWNITSYRSKLLRSNDVL